MKNAINWFEIPASDILRATRFYGAILDTTLTTREENGKRFAFLPCAENGVGGSLTQAEGYLPGTGGTLVYLNAGKDLEVVLKRVEPAGGTVLLPKTSIGEWGYIAMFTDSEGNRVGLHSMG